MLYRGISMRLITGILAAVMLTSSAVAADSGKGEMTMNTMTADSTTTPIRVPIDSFEFIVGHWRGEALGGMCEEIWSPPLGDAMMCAFRLVKDGQTSFYEMVSLIELEDRVEMRLKHFNTDLVGWEEKDEIVSFPLLKLEKNTAWFDGLTMQRVDPGTLLVHVRTSDKGKESELEFRYRRVMND